MNALLNRDLTDSEAIEKVVKRLTGNDLTLSLEDLYDLGKEAGQPWGEIDEIAVGILTQHVEIFLAAFLAGYKVGRNPDLLILADQAGDGDE